ncbi:hypothetical protein CRE_19109 [Caenorhabditis remanei]|uniref:HAT C-terminal dimerisation domain-containing protein n=1 Tax=Caenorhabditis remanei TaxID=31234 RepID=E3MJC8_CAERE|nr:hypothetical protein CRE_19109 [Caenorhabditis remanei]
MQTLQQARLTSKPPPLPGPSTSSGFSALAKAYDPSNKPPLVKAGGILRHRTINPMQEEPKPAEPDVKTIELLSRFFISSGVPLETVQERTFLDLVRHINPKIVLPEKTAMAKCVEKLGATTKPFVNFQKTVGPLCVTIDTDGTDDEKYLVFSIHYFEDLYERKQIVYLRKLLLSELDADSLLISVRRAVNNYTYVNVKFSNIVCPDDDVYNLVVNSDVVKRYHVCFYHYMKQFVFDLIEIEEFSRGLTELREFVRHIKKSADLYGKFRRMQLSKNAELDVPMIDDGPWENTSLFLTRCLVLHDTFTDFCERFNVTSYINNKTFNNLVYFQRLLSECVKHCRELSTPNSSISQVIPAIISLQRYIKNNDMGYRYTRIIRESLHTCFRQYLDGNMTLLYEMATLMDARYAYRDVLTPLRWKQLELKVAEDFVRTDAAMEKCFYQDLSLMNPEDRRTAIMAEFAHYRQVSFVERPEEAESPFLWWGRRHTDMEFLAVMAREYLAAPAVSVDATYYFANGGKFQHLCNTYSYGELESCLSLAGAHQKFVGRGASTDNITPDMIESLNSTANRLQKRTYFGLYTHGCDDVSTDREVAEIIGQPYPPIPTMAIRGHGFAQEEKPPTMAIPPIRRVLPNTQPVRQTKPSAITARPIQYKGAALGAVPKAIPIRQVPLQKLHPSQEKPMEEEKPAVFDHNAISKTKYWPQPKPLPQEEKPKDLLEKEVKQESQEPLLEKVKDEPLEEEPSTSLVGKVSNAVRKMSPLPTPANIIQHQQNQVQLNSPTLSQQGPPSTIIQANGIQTKRIIKNIHAPMPQNITPHNFVQKFAQKQNFVQKFTNRGVPQVPPANVQPPAGIRSPMTFQKPGQPSSSALPLHEPKIEEQLILAEQPDDFKMEPLDDFDDFNVVDDFSTYTSPRVIVHCEKLNDQSISNAYAR